MNFLDYAISQGFELYQGVHRDYSSLRHNGLDSRYKKGTDIIIWGLEEKGKSPTLIYPKPFGANTQDEVFKILKTFSNEEIYNSLFK